MIQRPMRHHRIAVTEGVPVTLIMPCSEVMLHMHLADTPQQVVLRRTAHGTFIVDLLQDGRPVSLPILPGEAGIIEGRDGHYAVVEEVVEAGADA